MQYLKYFIFLLAACFSYASAQTVYTDAKPFVIVQSTHPEFSIKLKSNPTTGYSWFLRSYDADFLHPIKHVYEAPTNKRLIGAPGFEVWTFQVNPESFVVPMQTLIRFVYARPWEESIQAKQVVFQVTIQKKSEQ